MQSYQYSISGQYILNHKNLLGACVHTVYFNYQGATGGTETVGKTVRYMDSYGDLPTPTRSYTVTFNANGGNTPSPSSKTVAYIFSGWYTAASGGTKVESTTVMSTRGGTLYARWTASTYGTLASCTRNASSDYTYSLRGWYTAASGGSKIISSTTANLTSDQTLYAQWDSTAQVATVTIKYEYGISRVTINGTSVSNGWSGTIKQGDVIVASMSGSNSYNNWCYDNNDGKGGIYFGSGSTATCTAPSSSGSGTLHFRNGGVHYYVVRSGACASWTFSAS